MSDIEQQLRCVIADLTEECKQLREQNKRVSGLRVTKDAGGAWLHFEAPSGKKAAISLEALGVQRGGLVGTTILEWADAA